MNEGKIKKEKAQKVIGRNVVITFLTFCTLDIVKKSTSSVWLKSLGTPKCLLMYII